MVKREDGTEIGGDEARAPIETAFGKKHRLRDSDGVRFSSTLSALFCHPSAARSLRRMTIDHRPYHKRSWLRTQIVNLVDFEERNVASPRTSTDSPDRQE